MKFKLDLTVSDNENKIKSINHIETADILQLASQFTLLILNIHREMHEDELLNTRINNNDDIPF